MSLRCVLIHLLYLEVLFGEQLHSKLPNIFQDSSKNVVSIKIEPELHLPPILPSNQNENPRKDLELELDYHEEHRFQFHHQPESDYGHNNKNEKELLNNPIKPKLDTQTKLLRRKRSVTDGDRHSGEPYSTKFDLHDDHSNAKISWAGKTPDVVALTHTYGGSKRANLYVSTDYGQNFTNVVDKGWSCLCTYVDGSLKEANLDNLYHASPPQTSSASATSYILTDESNQLIVYTRNLRDFTTVHVPFKPLGIAFHPLREDVVVAYGSDGTAFGRTRTNLYISYDFGAEWSLAKSNVHDIQWDFDNDALLVMLPTYLGLSAAAGIYDVKRMRFDSGLPEENVIADVHEFQLEGSFMFATKRSSRLLSSHLELHVSKNGSPFYKAEFPVLANHSNKEYYIVDADEDRVMVCVVHEVKSTHLYVSDATGTRYTLSLPNVVYISPTSVGSSALPGLMYYNKPYADVHKVKGLKGIYIASQFLSNGSANLNIANMNQTTRITYDKGGEWTHVSAPFRDLNSEHTHCFWFSGCTLHLLQEFSYGSHYYTAPLLSSSNAIGLVMGSGVMGYTLKQDTSPSVFLSTDAGFNWKEVARGNYTFNFGDHGNLIVLLPLRKLTSTLLYSHDEGESWNEYEFVNSPIVVYGLLTEPGSKTANFSIWGSKTGTHSWIIVHLNLQVIFSEICDIDDYKEWSPGIDVTLKEICLLGEQEVIERKIPSSLCFNGKEYERVQFSKTCKCVRSDYECDYGYIRVNETEDLWNPFPSIHFTEDVGCVRDYDVNITMHKPDVCPYGTSYEVTKGYRKIPGDVCQGGDNHKYDKIQRNCPNNDKVDFLIYSVGTSIYKYDLMSGKKEFLVNGSAHNEIYSVEFDYNRDVLFWADQDTDSVMYYNVSAPYPTPQVLVSGNLGKIESLSLDWESENIYLLDSRTPKIEIFTVFTRWRRTIVKNNETYPNLLEKPRALEVFPLHGLMFWTDWSQTSPRVMRAGMSGLDPKTIVTGAENGLLFWPNGLAVDFDLELIYIIDGFTHKLLVCGLDGSNLRTMLSDSSMIRHPFSLSLLKDRLYWSDWTDNQIKSVYRDKEQADGFYVVTSSEQRIMSVKAMNWDKQYQAGHTGCGMSNTTNGGCSNICVPSAHPNRTVSTHRFCLCSDESKPHDYITDMNEVCECKGEEKFNLTSGNCEIGSGQSCDSEEFECSSGNRCILSTWRCDSERDCTDGSDEYNCPSQLCESDKFLCKSIQRCINDDWVCDGDNDCGDWSDEANCQAGCQEGYFQCDNNRCIRAAYQCDGENDCGFGDDSDERNCNTTVTACTSGQFSCISSQSGLNCIPSAWKCDHETDCDDNSDEKDCGTTTCSLFNQFQCANNASYCIPKNWLCDGYNDCGDYSDERECSTTLPPTTLSPTQPTDCLCMNNGRCVSYNALCDGERDCPDGRDEYACSFTTTQFTPTCNGGFRCYDGSCLLRSQVCDGTEDCNPFHEDEDNCGQCRPDQVRCALNKQQCINSTQLCDGRVDCFGASDEEGCSATTVAPASCPGAFQCARDKTCIDLRKVCDDNWDCFDGSDEDDRCSYDVSITGLNGRPISSTSAAFNWTKRVAGTVLSVRYLVQYKDVADVHAQQNNNSKFINWINATITDNTSVLLTNLEPYTNYMFIVRALVTTGDREKMGPPSEILKLHTPEDKSGPVSHITAKVDEHAPEPGVWIISWRYPLHPRGRIFKYKYDITANGRSLKNGEMNAQGTAPAVLHTSIPFIYDTKVNPKMTITVWAVNGAGEGEKSNMSHCLELDVPTIKCAASTTDSVTLVVQANQDTRLLFQWRYAVRLTYIDVDFIPRSQTLSLNSKMEDYDVTIRNLGAGRVYDISAEVERWEISSLSSDTPSCTSDFTKVHCNTSGVLMSAVTGLTVTDVTTNTAQLEWTPVKGTKIYEIVVATQKAKLEEGEYRHTYTSVTNKIEITDLLSCEPYFFAVRSKSPYSGPLSIPVHTRTLEDYLGPPRHLSTSSPPGDGLTALLYPNIFGDAGSDPIDVTISWIPSCNVSKGAHIFYIAGDDIDIKPLTIPKGIHHKTVTLQRSGEYTVTIQNALQGGSNSSRLHFKPAAYKSPIFTIYNESDQLHYTLKSYYTDLYGSSFLGKVAPVHVNIQYQYGDGELVDNGYEFIAAAKGACNVTLQPGVYDYTIKMRYVRSYNGRQYYGRYGSASITINTGEEIPAVGPVAPHTGKGNNKGPVGMYVGIIVSVVVVLVLGTLLTVWCVRHRRLQRSFLDFTTSHYNTRTDNATFSNDDDDDTPLIQGFSDDEPLVIA